MTNLPLEDQPSAEPTIDGKAMYLLTAGGRIRCKRCQARSSQKKQQCGKPALKTSTKQLCNTHGGRPHTAETLQRISQANTIHGEFSKISKEQYRKDAIFIRQLEACMGLLEMGKGPKIRGRKPAGYIGVHSIEDVVSVLLKTGEHTI